MKKHILITVIPFIIAFFYAVFALSAAPERRVASVHVNATLLTLDSKQIRDLIPLKPGDVFTPEKLEDARKALLDTHLFESIEVRPEKRSLGTAIVFTLVEIRHIRHINLKGHSPYLEKKILRLSALQPGGPFREDLVAQSVERIQDFFEKEGYFGTKVAVEPPEVIAKNMVDLKITVIKGQTLKLGNIHIEGNQAISDKRLRNKIFSYGHFNPRRVRSRLKAIQGRYIKKGFVRSRVKLAETDADEQKKKVAITVEIAERARLVPEFKGNSFFSDVSLKKHVTFYEERGYDRFALERSVERLKDFYRVNGFIEATVDAELEKDAHKRTALFTIHEGPRTRLKKIVFKGNKLMKGGKLGAAMASDRHTLFQQGFFREGEVVNDLEKIEEYYSDQGFFDARVLNYGIELNRFHDQATLTIEVDEGEPYRLTAIAVSGNAHMPTEKILKEIKKGKFYESRKIEKARKKILALYQEEGFPHAGVSFAKYSNQPGSADLDIIIDEGKRVTIRNIIVNGHLLTKEKVIREAIKVDTGDFYTYKGMLNAQLNLKRLGIFDYVRIQPVGLSQERDQVDLVINATERKDKTVELQAGFDSDKLGQGQFIFTKRNLFGAAKQIQFRALGGFELDRGEMTFYSPRVFGASWNLANQYFVQYEDAENFNATSYGGSLGVVKPFGPNWTLLIKEQVTKFNIFEGQSNQKALKKNLFDSTFSELLASASFDTRDNFADPRKGIYSLVSTEFDSDLADLKNNFNISSLNVSHYWGLLKRLTLTNTFRFGKLWKINSSARIPATKLFFMGGNDTVRGFDEDAIRSSGGTTSLIYNAELSYRIYNNFKLAGFFDMGSLTDQFSEISTNSLRESAGAGIRYVTPVGPIRLDYGFVLDKKPGEKGHRFHFSFGYFF